MLTMAMGATLGEARVLIPGLLGRGRRGFTGKRQLMNGIHAAFTGRIGKPAEVRTGPRRQTLGFLPWRWIRAWDSCWCNISIRSMKAR